MTTVLYYTDNILRKTLHSRGNALSEYYSIFKELDVEVPAPNFIGKVGNVYHLLYPKQSKPSCFSNDYEHYSVRVDNSLQQIVEKKGYLLGNPLNKNTDFVISATGIFEEDPLGRYTLYKSTSDDNRLLTKEELYECLEELTGITYDSNDNIIKVTDYVVE